MEHEFEYQNRIPLKEIIYVQLGSAGEIVKAEMMSRILGSWVDITESVKNNADFKKEIYEDFYYSERERKFSEI